MNEMNQILSRETKLLEEKKWIEERERELRNRKKAVERKLKTIEREKEDIELARNAKRNKQIAEIVEETYGTVEDMQGFEQFMKEKAGKNWEMPNLNPEL